MKKHLDFNFLYVNFTKSTAMLKEMQVVFEYHCCEEQWQCKTRKGGLFTHFLHHQLIFNTATDFSLHNICYGKLRLNLLN